jgi:hypothetical protein
VNEDANITGVIGLVVCGILLLAVVVVSIIEDCVDGSSK